MPDEDIVPCFVCGKETEPVHYDEANEGYLCDECQAKDVNEWEREAQGIVAQLKIIREFPKYDSSKFQSITREEYEDGIREAYTPNAYRTKCRHEYTNYDELLKTHCEPPTTADDRSSVIYCAIREKVHEMVEEEILRVNGEPPELL